MTTGRFYAVAIGRSIGVFTTWAECEAQVKGCSGCKYKKFKTHDEARAFVNEQTGRQRNVEVKQNTTRKRLRDEHIDCRPPCAQKARHEQTGRQRNVEVKQNTTRKRLRDEHIDCRPPCAQKARHDPTNVIDNLRGKGSKPGVVTTKKETDEMIKGQSDNAEVDALEQTSSAGLTDCVSNDSLTSLATMLKDEKERDCADANQQSDAVAITRKIGDQCTSEETTSEQPEMSPCAKKSPSKEQNLMQDAATACHEGGPDPNDPTTLVAFCDGSALMRGQHQSCGGYACIFPHREEWDVAKQLVMECVTNNRAEFMAAYEAMKRANVEDPNGSRLLYIFSDSMLLIRCMTEWVDTWQKNNWKKTNGQPVKNRDLLELLVAEKGSRCICWKHVKAHTGKKDWMSTWNDVADKAARNAASSSVGEV